MKPNISPSIITTSSYHRLPNLVNRLNLILNAVKKGLLHFSFLPIRAFVSFVMLQMSTLQAIIPLGKKVSSARGFFNSLSSLHRNSTLRTILSQSLNHSMTTRFSFNSHGINFNYLLTGVKKEKGSHYPQRGLTSEVGYSLIERSAISLLRVSSIYGEKIRFMSQKVNLRFFDHGSHAIKLVKLRTKNLINYAVAIYTTCLSVSTKKVALLLPSSSYQWQESLMQTTQRLCESLGRLHTKISIIIPNGILTSK